MAVYISQDGFDQDVHDVSLLFGKGSLSPPHTRAFAHWQRERIPLLHAKQVSHAWLALYLPETSSYCKCVLASPLCLVTIWSVGALLHQL